MIKMPLETISIIFWAGGFWAGGCACPIVRAPWAYLVCCVCRFYAWSPVPMPLCYLLCLPGLLCLLLSSMPTRSPVPVSACTESICLVILPGVLPGLLPAVPGAVFMYSAFIVVFCACLVCYGYVLVMPIHAVSVVCSWLAMVCPAVPARSPLPALSSAPMLCLLCLRASPVTYALS